MGNGVVLATLFSVASTVVACSGSALVPAAAGLDNVASNAGEWLQLIVKFRDVSDSSDPAFLETLSSGVGAPVRYVRPVSGGFHLVRVFAPPGSVDALVERLKSRREVSHVEADLPVRRQ